MSDSQRFAEREEPLRRYEYEDAVVFAADLGAGVDGASVDVVEGTAMVVVDGRQYEFDVPAGEAKASIRNGVVTVEVTR